MKITKLALLAFTLSAPTAVFLAKANDPDTIALIGGTLVDVSHLGHSTHDIPNAVVLLHGATIAAAGSHAEVHIPKGAKILDYTGAYILPGLVDGFAGLNSQAQANATLYMGVTTIAGSGDDRRGVLKLDCVPSPHIYPIDSAGSTDNYSLLINLPEWSRKLKEGKELAELSQADTEAQLRATARRGTRAIWLGHNLTAAKTRYIIAECHRLGLITYGEFISTPFADGLKDGVDVLLHMTRYELGLVPDRLQRPLVTQPEGPAQDPAYAYILQLDTADPSITAYGRRIKASHAALMPTFSLEYLTLPDHRNLWKEPAAAILDPHGLHKPADPVTGEAKFPSPQVRDRVRAETAKFWAINRTLETVHPTYLAASGASAVGTMPGISMHTELELLVRLGLTPREALAAATSNYSEQFGWHELGLLEKGRRADLLILDADPTVDISNTRKIHSVLLGGTLIDRAALLAAPR